MDSNEILKRLLESEKLTKLINDIVNSKSEYKGYPNDTIGYAWVNNGQKHLRYYSRYEDGKHYCWDNSLNSCDNDNNDQNSTVFDYFEPIEKPKLGLNIWFTCHPSGTKSIGVGFDSIRWNGDYYTGKGEGAWQWFSANTSDNLPMKPGDDPIHIVI